MPITPKNRTKNAITPSSKRKGGYALWGDAIVKWADATLTWGAPFASLVNKVKNTITPKNKTK